MTTARAFRETSPERKSGDDFAILTGQIDVDIGIVANRCRHRFRQLLPDAGRQARRQFQRAVPPPANRA